MVAKDWSQESYLKTHHPEITLLPVDNLKEILLAVADKRAYAGISEKVTAQYVIQKEDIADFVVA